MPRAVRGVLSVGSQSSERMAQKEMGPVVGFWGRSPFIPYLRVGSTASGFLSVAGGSGGRCCVFGSFAPAATPPLYYWTDLSKNNSRAAARWEFSPEQEPRITSRSEELSTEGLNFE